MLPAWLRSQLPGGFDVDDVVQEAVLRVLRARQQGGVRSPKALLFVVARNLALMQLRRRRVAGTESLEEIDPAGIMDEEADVPRQVARAQELDMLAQAIQTLPVRCRQILTPRFLPGFTLNLDYWKIAKTDAITSGNVLVAFSNPDLYAFALTRAAPTASDIANGWVGVVTSLDQRSVNAATLETEGVDVRLRYSLKTTTLGSFMFNANASFTNNFLLQISPLVPPVNQVNPASVGPLKWRGHYSAAYTDPSPSFPGGFPLDGGRIPAYLHWDTQVSYEIPAGSGNHGWRDWVAGAGWWWPQVGPGPSKQSSPRSMAAKWVSASFAARSSCSTSGQRGAEPVSPSCRM